jgi:hypothetical protein
MGVRTATQRTHDAHTVSVATGDVAGMPGAATAGGCLMRRGYQALGRSGQLRLGADLELFRACFRSKPSGLCLGLSRLVGVS